MNIENLNAPTPDLGEFIDWLEEREPDTLIPLDRDIFSDRGDYAQVAIAPGESKARDLAKYLKSMLGKTMHGYKGGEYAIHIGCSVFVAPDSGTMGPRLGLRDGQVVTVGDGWNVR